jgi:predicted patatin/cPLA2 family phospholipase
MKSDLCIGGGSIKGLSFLGALEFISKNKKLEINNFYGCSIGSVIGIFYILGMEPLEMLNCILDIDLKDYWDFSIDKITKSYSMISDKIFDVFKKEFKKYVDENITFQEFYDKFKVNINITSVSLKTRDTTTFSYKTTPEIHVFDAIKASCSIPIMFPPTNINGQLYIDGCSKNMSGCSDEYIDGYTIILKQVTEVEINDVYSFSSELMRTLTGNKTPKSKYTIIIDNEKSMMDFSKIDYNAKIKLYHHGLKSAKQQLV